jgi:hypothetical protein
MPMFFETGSKLTAGVTDTGDNLPLALLALVANLLPVVTAINLKRYCDEKFKG